jgi:hypothetical protein
LAKASRTGQLWQQRRSSAWRQAAETLAEKAPHVGNDPAE